jgi:hypothetical protein
VSIVKGMTFVLIELESLEALQCVGLSGMSLSSDKMGLDEGWSRTFVGIYFFVRCGAGANGETLLRTRMIEGKSCDVYTACQLSFLSTEVQVPPHVYPHDAPRVTVGFPRGRRMVCQWICTRS